MTEEEFNKIPIEKSGKKSISEEEFNNLPVEDTGIMSSIKNYLSKDNPLLSAKTIAGPKMNVSNVTPEFPQGKPESVSKEEEGFGTGVNKIASGFTKPSNLALAASTAIPVIGPGIATGFGLGMAPSMAVGAYKGSKQALSDIENKKYEEAGENIANVVGNVAGLAGTALGGKSLLDEARTTPLLSDPYNKAATPQLKEMALRGDPLTAAEISKSPITESTQGFLERNPVSKKLFRKRGLEQEASIGKDVQDLSSQIGQTPANEVGEAIKSSTQPEGTYKKGVDEMLADFQEAEEGRKNLHKTNFESSKENLKALPEKEAITAGSDLENAVSKAHEDLNKSYEKQVGPILKKHLNKPASPEVLRQNIVELLDRNLVLDEKGNISQDAIDSIRSSERKGFVKKLAEYSEDLRKNPTVAKLSQITKDLQRDSNFGAIERTPEQYSYGELSHSAKESLLDSLEKHVGPEQVEQLRQARQTYASTRPILEELSKATGNKWSEQIVKGAKSNLPNELLKASVEKVPALKKSLGDVVINNIVQNASSAESFTKAIDNFGRDNLKSILGDEKFNSLEAAEENLSQASRPFEKGKAPKAIPQSLHGELSEHINKLATENPNGLADHVVRPNEPQRVSDYKKILGDNFKPIKQQLTKKLLGDHSDYVNSQGNVETAEGVGGEEIKNSSNVKGKSLRDSLDHYGDSLKEVYTPEELKKLNDIADKAESFQVALRAKRPPMAPRGVKALLGKIGGGMVLDPLARMWLSKTGTRALTTTMPRFGLGTPMATNLSNFGLAAALQNNMRQKNKGE